MRNMKRALSLLIALITVAAFMVVPSFASTAYTATPVISAIEDKDDVKAHFGTTDSAVDPTTLIMKSTSPNGGASIVIDFSKEIIYWELGKEPAGTKADGSDAPPAFVSFDNGGKWSALKFSIGTDAGEGAADFSKNLNKESTILLASALGEDKKPQKAVTEVKDAEGNVTTEGVNAAITWSFAKISARPKLGKFAVDYLPLADKGENGKWTLKKTGEMAVSAVELAYSADKKTATGGYWFQVSDLATDNKGVNVVSGENKPGEKLSFLVRVAPTTSSAGSKPKKLNVSTLIKAPTLKIDYKKNLIKAKANMYLAKATVAGAGTEADPFKFDDWATSSDATDTSIIANIAKPYTKTSKEVKPGVTVVLDPTNPTYYGAVMAATEKKPASEIQFITVNPKTPITESDASVEIKKQTVKLPKGYELAPWADRDKPATKWKNSAKVERSGKYAVRLKNTAKYNAKENTTSNNTISGNLILDVVLGKDEKSKPIVTKAVYIHDDGADTPTVTASKDEAKNVYVASADLAIAVDVMEDDTTAADAQSGEIAYVGPVLTDSTTHALSFTPATLGTGDAAVQVSTKITIDGQKIKYNFASGVPAGNEPITITAKIAPLGTANAGLITTEIVFTVTPQGISAAPVVAITGNSTITVGDIAGTVQVGESNNTAYTYKWYASADTTLTDTEKETVLSTNWRLDLVDITALDDLADKEFVYLFCEVINTEEGKAPSAPVTSTGFKVTAAEPAPDPVADLATVTGVKNSLVLIALRPASSSSTWTQDNAETAIKGKANALANGCNLTYSFTSFEAGNLSSVAAGTITVTITITKNSQTVTTDSLTIPLQY